MTIRFRGGDQVPNTLPLSALAKDLIAASELIDLNTLLVLDTSGKLVTNDTIIRTLDSVRKINSTSEKWGKMRQLLREVENNTLIIAFLLQLGEGKKSGALLAQQELVKNRELLGEDETIHKIFTYLSQGGKMGMVRVSPLFDVDSCIETLAKTMEEKGETIIFSKKVLSRNRKNGITRVVSARGLEAHMSGDEYSAGLLVIRDGDKNFSTKQRLLLQAHVRNGGSVVCFGPVAGVEYSKEATFLNSFDIISAQVLKEEIESGKGPVAIHTYVAKLEGQMEYVEPVTTSDNETVKGVEEGMEATLNNEAAMLGLIELVRTLITQKSESRIIIQTTSVAFGLAVAKFMKEELKSEANVAHFGQIVQENGALRQPVDSEKEQVVSAFMMPLWPDEHRVLVCGKAGQETMHGLASDVVISFPQSSSVSILNAATPIIITPPEYIGKERIHISVLVGTQTEEGNSVLSGYYIFPDLLGVGTVESLVGQSISDDYKRQKKEDKFLVLPQEVGGFAMVSVSDSQTLGRRVGEKNSELLRAGVYQGVVGRTIAKPVEETSVKMEEIFVSPVVELEPEAILDNFQERLAELTEFINSLSPSYEDLYKQASQVITELHIKELSSLINSSFELHPFFDELVEVLDEVIVLDTSITTRQRELNLPFTLDDNDLNPSNTLQHHQMLGKLLEELKKLTAGTEQKKGNQLTYVSLFHHIASLLTLITGVYMNKASLGAPNVTISLKQFVQNQNYEYSYLYADFLSTAVQNELKNFFDLPPGTPHNLATFRLSSYSYLATLLGLETKKIINTEKKLSKQLLELTWTDHITQIMSHITNELYFSSAKKRVSPLLGNWNNLILFMLDNAKYYVESQQCLQKSFIDRDSKTAMNRFIKRFEEYYSEIESVIKSTANSELVGNNLLQILT
jgi:hypothetical protein